MASKTVSTGNAGSWQIIIDQVSQSESANTSRVRVRGVLKNVDGGRAFVNDAHTVTIRGTNSWTGSTTFDLSSGESKTVIDETFTVSHSSNGTKTVTYEIDFESTGTWTIGNPPALELSMTLDPISQASVPSKIDDIFVRYFTAPGTLGVDWTAPASNGSSITRYDIQWDSNSSFSSPGNTTNTTSSKVLTGLAKGNTYWVRARAVNGVGAGPWSTKVASYYIPTVPTAPSAPAPTFFAPSTLSLAWAPPSSNGGAAITSYDFQWANNGSFSGAGNRVTTTNATQLTGLTLGQTWYMRVRATNSQGDGPWSAVMTVAIPNVPGAPAAPSLVYDVPDTIRMTWAHPSNGGANITGYDIQYSTSSSFASGVYTVASSSPSATISGLEIGKTWYFRTRAKNSQGVSGWSPSSLKLIVCGPQIKVAGVWTHSVAYVKVGGVWKVAIPYVKVAGVWKIAGG